MKIVNIKRLVLIFGIINTLNYLVYLMLSYGLAPHTPRVRSSPSRGIFVENFANGLKFLPDSVISYIKGEYIFKDGVLWTIAYSLPMVVGIIVFIVLLRHLAIHQSKLSSDIPKQLYKWAVLFSVISALAIPVLVHDFWYPIAWGRMVMNGINPYYTAIKDQPGLVNDLHMRESTEKMMYGPLWAIMNGMVMGLARGNLWLGAFFFKILFLGAWIGSLTLIFCMLQKNSIWSQAVGMLIFGWIPVSIVQSVGDGHNDIVVVFFVLFWLYALEKKWNFWPRLSLFVSILIKYVSAPLILLDLIHWYFEEHFKFWKYLIYILISLTFSLLIFSVFFRSFEMFDYIFFASAWHFYAPADAIRTLFSMIGLNIRGATLVARIFFSVVFVFYTYQYIKDHKAEKFWTAVLSTLALILFGVNRHIWPWYILWVLSIAALSPGSLLSRWIIGIGLFIPFPILMWIGFPASNDYYKFALPALIFYVCSILWLIFVPSRWFPNSPQQEIKQMMQ